MIVAEISDWGFLIGRLHPLFVHLPIGTLFIAVLFEVLSLFRKYAQLKQTIGVLWLVTSITSVAACLAGYLLSGEAGYNENILQLHQWSGISLAVLSTVIFVVKFRYHSNPKLNLFLAGFALVLLLFTGHQGGTLTHGEDYLREPIALIMGQEPELGYVTPPRVKISDPEKAIVYVDLVQPLFEQKCARCHNPQKAKGKFDLTDYSALMKGGKGGKVMVAGAPEESELYKRLILPKLDKKHMPPKSKDQLSPEEIRLVEWWIREGKGDRTIRVSDLQKSESVMTLLASFTHVDSTPVNEHDNEFAEIMTDTVSEYQLIPLRQAGLVVTRLSPGSSLLSVNCVNSPNFDDAQLKLLEPVKNQIVWLKAGNTLVTNFGLKEIAMFKNLTRLNLENTSVTEAGLIELAKLSRLQYLNLVGTAVDDKGIQVLARMENLKRLHLWKSRLTQNGVNRLKTMLPQTEINAGEFNQDSD